MGTLTTIFDIRIAGNAKKSLDRTTTAAQGLNKSVSSLGEKIRRLGTLSFGINAIMSSFRALANQVTKCTEAYKLQAVAETKLATIMRQTMGAMNFEIESIKKLASEQQKLGVIGDEIQLAGAQELSTYLTKTSSLKKLIPVMNDMLAQQYGLNTSQEQAVTIAQMMGKVLDGQVGALRRYGYRFDEAQEAILKFGNEEQRVAMLAEVITQYVGGVNAALAQTPEGKLKQHANDVGDIREEWGRLFVSIQSALLPLREKIAGLFSSAAAFFNQNKDKIMAAVSSMANYIGNALTSIGGFLARHASALIFLAKTLIVIKTATIAYTVVVKACAAATALWRSITVLARIAVVAYNRGIQTATRLMLGFNTAVKLNPVGLLIGVVTAAITAFSLFRKRTNEATKALDDAKKVAGDYYAQERSQLDMMFAKLRQTNPKSAERNRLVNELMQMYPELNRQQSDELRNTNNLAAAYETLAASIAKKARVKGMESALEELSKDTAETDMAIENYLSNTIKRKDFPSDNTYSTMKSVRREQLQNAVISLNAKKKSGNFHELDYFEGILFNEIIGGTYSKEWGKVKITELGKNATNAAAAYSKIADVQKFLSSYMFDPGAGGFGGSGGGGSGDGFDPSGSATEITGGGKGVKNFYVHIENLLGENTNIFQSSKDSPETAGDFLERLSHALQDVVNDVNYAAG